MNHYDGPAFYRRFLNQAMGENAQQNQLYKRHIKHKRIHLKNDDIKTNNPIAEMTENFKPNKKYYSKHSYNHHVNFIHPQFDYEKLITELNKTSDSYILISTKRNNMDQKYERINYNSNDKNNEILNSNQSQQLYQHKTTSKELKPQSINQTRALNNQNSNNNDVSNNKPSSNVSNTATIASKNTKIDSDASTFSQANNKSNTASQANSSVSSQYGLGSTLSSILNDETNHQDNSKLFDDHQTNHQSEHSNHNYSDDNSQYNDSQNENPDVITNPSNSNNFTHGSNNIKTEDKSVEATPVHEQIKQINHPEHGYHFPNPNLLKQPMHFNDEHLNEWIKKQAQILNKTLDAFNVDAEVVDWTNGPTVTQFRVKLKLGVKVSKITNLTDDLKLALAAKDIRIEAPIPGHTTVGIEIPNPQPRPVLLSEVINSRKFRNSKDALTVALGVDLTGQPQITDIRKMPHGLIAGATGSGKSVFINSLLISLLYKDTPAELRLILIDPKAVELAPYNGIPHLLSPVISDPKQASAALKWAMKEMDQRYERLAAAGVRNIEQYNKEAEKHQQYGLKMPYIVIVIDELADLMMAASTEVEDYIVRITQKARAAGIHLIVATQRPSVDIITGTIKNNIPTRVAFMVSSQVDSRTIIDSSGAERLLGKGDMLYVGSGSSQPIRLQGTFVGNQEIEKVTGFIRNQGHPNYAFQPKSLLQHVDKLENQDKLMPQVLKYISNEKTISTSKLQRVFSIGYNRAASLIDDLEKSHYVSSQHGSKPRDVYLTKKDYQKLNQ